MTGTTFPHALGPYRNYSVTNDPGIGGRVSVELENGRVVAAEAWPADGWDDPRQIDWNKRIIITIDEHDAREMLSSNDFEELRGWMLYVLAEAGALNVELDTRA